MNFFTNLKIRWEHFEFPKLPKLPSLRRERYMFTDNKHPDKGIMSFILGVISVASFAAAAYFTFKNGGQAQANYAFAVILAGIYSIAGLVLGIISRFEKDIYKLFPNLGIALNIIGLLCFIGIIYLAII